MTHSAKTGGVENMNDAGLFIYLGLSILIPLNSNWEYFP